MLKSGVGPLAIGSGWLAGEHNRSTCAAVLGKKAWEMFKVESAVMSTNSTFIQ